MKLFVCTICGKVFPPDDAKTVTDSHGLDDGGPGEAMLACPACGHTDLSEAVSCEGCGDLLEPGTAYDGRLCLDCVKNWMTIENWKKWATTGAKHTDDVDAMEEFVATMLWHLPEDSFRVSSAEFKLACQAAFGQAILFEGSPVVEALIVDYMSDTQWEDFAEWLRTEGKHV